MDRLGSIIQNSYIYVKWMDRSISSQLSNDSHSSHLVIFVFKKTRKQIANFFGKKGTFTKMLLIQVSILHCESLVVIMIMIKFYDQKFSSRHLY